MLCGVEEYATSETDQYQLKHAPRAPRAPGEAAARSVAQRWYLALHAK